MSPSPNQSLTFDDFSGGRTDNYFLAPLNQFNACDNLFPTRHGQKAKLLSRPGSELFDVSNPKTNPDGSRVAALTFFSGELLSIAARKIRYKSGAWTELTGPTGNSLFPVGTTTDNVVSYATWNNHLFITNDSFPNPSKVYVDGSSVRRLRTAGLPRLASQPTLGSFAAGNTSFLYKFVHKYTYTVGTVTYIDRGRPTDSVQALADDPPNIDSIVVSAIPVLANGAITNWDTVAIKIEVYRTIANGTVFYYVGEVTNGTTTYTDTSSDSTIQANEKLYTEGGVIANDPVPFSKFVFILKDKAYWCHIKDSSGQIFENRVRQSVPGDLDSAPESFFVDVQDSIVGGGSAKGLPLIVCRNSVYRIEGEFDLLGRGGMVAFRIQDTSSCVSSQSIVSVPDGLVWAGEDGYYFSDGYQILRISQDWIDSYRVGVQNTTLQSRIHGKFDSINRRVWWTIQEDVGGGDDCSRCDVLHLDWPLRDNSTFTSVSGLEMFAPTALEFVGERLYHGNRYGYLLIHDPDMSVDVKVDDSASPSTWATQTIYWSFISVATDFNVPNMRKYTPRVILSGRNLSNASIQISSVEDDGRILSNLKPIRWRGSFTWQDPLFIWGSVDFVWGSVGLIEEQRRFPAKSLRCDFKQLAISNANVPIINSDSFGTVTIDGTLKTATFDLGSSSWPTDSVDYALRIETDGFVFNYPVESNTSTTLTLIDTNNTLVNAAGLRWILNGYPKGEILNLMGFAIDFLPLGATEQSFSSSTTGEIT